ncbi:MAG TPA: arylsulfatase A [Planctomycetes bacterium]|nr:arylsulfatase A [Planctomycetota bacterium]
MHRLGLLVVGLFISLSWPSLVAAKDALNIVLIMADDVGYECFSSYGSETFSTPVLDELARSGIRFENCHSTPLCTPSRVNLMSGKSNVYNYQDFGVYPKGEPTFANYLKKFGYRTAVAGKWQLAGNSRGIMPEEAGFDTHCLWNIPGSKRPRYWDPSYVQNGKTLKLPRGTYGPDVMTDFIIDFVVQNKDKPFLAYYPMNLVHNPFPPTPDSVDRNEKNNGKNFIDMVSYMDKCVGRIVDTLDSHGLRDNTLLIFTGDNGTNHVLTYPYQGKSFTGGKGFTFDHGTHVPLIANWPGKIPAGQVNDDLICFSDFFPTMVDAVGLEPKNIANGDGQSFWSQLQGKPAEKTREWIYGYYFPRPYAKKFDDMYNHWEVRFARDKQFKLYGNGELYDTVKDVLEQNVISVSQDTDKSKLARIQLQIVLDSYPANGRGVERSKVNGVRKP